MADNYHDNPQLYRALTHSLWCPIIRRTVWTTTAFAAGFGLLCMISIDLPLTCMAADYRDSVGRVARVLTNLNAFGTVWPVITTLLVYGLVTQRKPFINYPLFTVLAFGVSAGILHLGKISFGRARPAVGLGSALHFQPFTYGYNFAAMPSGHATDAGVLLAVAFILKPKLGIALIPLAIALAATRVMTLSHWASDVVIGLLLGFNVTLLLHAWFVARDVRAFNAAQTRETTMRALTPPLTHAA